MNEEFYRRQAENNQEHSRQQAAQQSHSTLETYQLEQHEAQAGHFNPGPSGERNTVTTPSLWQRIRKMLGMA